MKQYLVLRVSALLLAVLCFCSTARAWEEISVQSHHTQILVEKDGSAEVRHELILKVRGGPVRSVLLPGVGEVSRLLSDAQVSRARLGSAGIWPLELSVDESGTLRLEVLGERGLRGGNYRFQFSYILDLKKRGWLKLENEGALLTWVAPRFPSGIYSAKATFSLPHSLSPPSLEEDEDGQFAGVLLSELRRGSDRDEIELVRAYVAAEEPALFQIRAPQELFVAPKADVAVADDLPQLMTSQLPKSRARWLWFWSGLFGLSLGSLVWRKALEVSAAAARVHARARPLIPAPAGLRGLLVALFALLSAHYFFNDRSELALLFAMPCLLLSSFLLATRLQKARGPGNWRPVIDIEQLQKSELEGKFEGEARFQLFDQSKALGAFFLFAVTTSSALGAWLSSHQSPYYALGSIGALLLTLPLFFTGQSKSLPKTPLVQVLPYFERLRERLSNSPVSFELWGRQQLTIKGEESRWVEDGYYDEMRIRLVLDAAVSGLKAFEVSFDEMSGDWLRPCVVLKVMDESVALSRLPNSIVWRRGIRTEEKVALVALRSNSEGELLSLLRGLISSLRKSGDSQDLSRDPNSAKARRSGANSAST